MPTHGKTKPFVVVLDPGHGGQDSGAMCGNVMEKDLTLDVARRGDADLRFRQIRLRPRRGEDDAGDDAERHRYDQPPLAAAKDRQVIERVKDTFFHQ